jgi:hypothetical protein
MSPECRSNPFEESVEALQNIPQEAWQENYNRRTKNDRQHKSDKRAPSQ